MVPNIVTYNSTDTLYTQQIEHIRALMLEADERLVSNPLDASANARYKYYSIVLAELTKDDQKYCPIKS